MSLCRDPSTPPSQLPQFDSASPSLQLLPIQFPDYNDIDSIDSQNVIRFGLRNTLQTKRDGQLDNLLDWNVMLDWRLTARKTGPTNTFNDLYSDLAFRPRSWLTLESQMRYDINNGDLNMAFHQLTFTPNERWSWGIGHGIRAADSWTAATISSAARCFSGLNDNWGFRTTHDFNARTAGCRTNFTPSTATCAVGRAL